MKIAVRFLTLTCAVGTILAAGSAQARSAPESYCDWQLQQCLMIAIVPEPCYQEYEACMAGGYAAQSAASTAGPRGKGMRRD